MLQITERDLVRVCLQRARPMPPLRTGYALNATDESIKAGDAVVRPAPDDELDTYLQVIAYGDALTVQTVLVPDGPPRRVAWYRRGNAVVRQELRADGVHVFCQAEPSERMGLSSLLQELEQAVTGQTGSPVPIHQEAWNLLLEAYLGGEGQSLLAALTEAAGDDPSGRPLLRFSGQVLRARRILDVIVVTDCLANRGDWATFVLTDKANWLVTAASKGNLWALETSNQRIRQTAWALFADLNGEED